MNTIKKVLVGAAAVAMISSPAVAEEIVIGAQIAPIASLVILGGNTNLDFDELTATGIDGSAIAKGVSVAKFFVNTNMPKWNLYLAFGNGGRLRNSSGVGLNLDGALIKFSGDLNVCDDAVCTNASINTDAVDLIVMDPMPTTAVQSLRDIVDNVVTADGTNWFQASGVNVFSADILVGAVSDVANVPTLAGTYTETIYLTLATTY